VFIFCITDSCNDFDVPSHVKFYRTSLYKSRQKQNEFILPFVWKNVESSYFPLPKTSDNIKPTVGFCGQVVANRRLLLQKIIQSNVTTNFIIRDKFWGGKEDDPTLFKEFQDNIMNSHFTLCNRGTGNFSMRFYQVLSAGRIPILVDSDMVFPFEDQIKWDDVVIRANTEDEVVDLMHHWWATKDMVHAQMACKKISDDYFNKENYFTKLFTNTLNQMNNQIE
jgi:hypothetical protein